MATPESPPWTVTEVHPTLPQDTPSNVVLDASQRRYLSWSGDFDSRSAILTQPIGDHWDVSIKTQWERNKASIRSGLIKEYGEHAIETKIQNFIAIDTKPFSIVTHHNQFFHQIRQAFVMGNYYPALVGACTLGERILNHLILDLRSFYPYTEAYRRVYKKKSFDDWDVAIDSLDEWGIWVPTVADTFRQLKKVRHRSIHFNPSTYNALHSDTLTAILHLRDIIAQQFGSMGTQSWFIPGTHGHVFIKKDFETHPFVKTYFLPRCPFVGHLFAIDITSTGFRFYDRTKYGSENWTDEEFARQYNDRKSNDVVKTPRDYM